MAEFHLSEGFTYERVSESGDMRLRLRTHHGDAEVVREVTVPENEWASVLAFVSARGEDGDTYQAARDLHAGRIVPGVRAKHRRACGRLMVGSGTDTHDPICELPEGHEGICASTAAIDPDGVTAGQLEEAWRDA